MVTSAKHKLLPIIPLARDGVLLPGVNLRIPVSNRPDIPALLSSIYSRAKTPRPDTSSISVGCVPLCSPLLSPEGQNLLEDAEIRVRKTAEHLISNPSKAGEKDLFAYGTVAKISGVQGRRPGDLALVVEGVRRFRIERFTQFKPYTEAEIIYIDEDGKHTSGKIYEAC
jgi:ATP-dependent Lon protease